MWTLLFVGSSTELDALLGTGASNSTVTVMAAPGAANATAKSAPKGFDTFTPDYMGASGASQVCAPVCFEPQTANVKDHHLSGCSLQTPHQRSSKYW